MIGICYSPNIAANVWEIKVVKYTDLLFLIGAGILCGGFGGQNTCSNSIQALGAGHGKVEFMVGSSTKTGKLHLVPFRKGHQDLAQDQ